MALCPRLVGGPKSAAELWDIMSGIADGKRKTSGDITVSRDSKHAQFLRDETISATRCYDTECAPMLRIDKIRHLWGPATFRVYVPARDNTWDPVYISASMISGEEMRNFDLWNYSLMLMLECSQ